MSAAVLPELTETQQAALKDFRKAVSDVLNDSHDDYFLLRWLKARKFNLEAAEKMLRDSLLTRAAMNVENLEKWDAPKALREYLPYGLVGYDNEGSPVLVCPFYKLDMHGMLHCVTRFEFQRYLILMLERTLKAGIESSKEFGPKARQVVVYFDMADCNIKQYMWRPAAECVLSSVKLYEANYPEMLKMSYMVNAPKLFSVAFNFVKKFLDEYTMSKINIYKSGSDKWKDQIFTHVNPDIFPKCMGGNYVDESGDPECKSMIIWGGKIPVELYVDKKDEENNDRDYIETTVNKGNKLKVEFDVGDGKKDNILTWEFRTFDYDIKFGIYSLDGKTGEKRNEVALGTVYSNDINEIGYILTRPHTKYVMVFDNSGSYLHSKKLKYFAELTSEVDIVAELSAQVDKTEIAVKAPVDE